ncbi:MAG: hypothetical protein GY820_18415 [Gammaproteobacteria bacterium]|nr:hypothetical protein [Gammaproteobacteria bacterium]
MKGVNRISLPEDGTVEQSQETSSQGPNLFENLAKAFPTPNLPASTHSTPDTSLGPTGCATAKVSSTVSAVLPITTAFDIDLGNVSSAGEGSQSGLASKSKSSVSIVKVLSPKPKRTVLKKSSSPPVTSATASSSQVPDVTTAQSPSTSATARSKPLKLSGDAADWTPAVTSETKDTSWRTKQKSRPKGQSKGKSKGKGKF